MFLRFMLSGFGSSGLTAGASVTTTGTVLRNIHFSGVGVCLSGIDCRLVHMKKHWILSCMYAVRFGVSVKVMFLL